MNAKKETMMHRLLSGVSVLLGFSAEDGGNQLYMYGTIPVNFIRSVVTDVNEELIEGIYLIGKNEEKAIGKRG